MAIASPINLNKVSEGINSLKIGLGNLKKSSDTIKIVTLNRTKIKRESFARDRILSNIREEAVKRKDQESIIEASGVGGAFKRTASVISDSTKGFLGRILDFASSLLIGWLLYNLPTIMTGIEDLIIRIKSLTELLGDFISNIGNMFRNFGQLLSGVYYDITHFDFTDQSKRVQGAMDDLNANFDAMHDQFTQGFDMLSKPLGEGPGEKEVPALNTDYTQPGPTTGESGGGTAPPAPKGADPAWAKVYEAARKEGDRFPEVTATQWAIESGWGKSPSGKNNFFGQKASANEPGTWLWTTENINGKNVRVKAKFRDYETPEEGVRAKVKRWDYKYGNAKTPEEAARNMSLPTGAKIPGTNMTSHGVYATSPTYSTDIINIIKRQGIDPKKPRTGPAPAITTKASAPSKPQSGKGNGYLTSADLIKIKPLSSPADYKDWYGNNAMLNPTAGKAFLAAQQAYGKDIPINSAYRSYKHQENVKGSVKATPGYSRHGVGLALDLEPNTPAYNWMVKNGPKYGWYYAKISGDPFHFEYRGGGVKPIQSQPAQVSPTTQPGQNVPSVAKNKKGPTVLVADNPSPPPAPQQVSTGGRGSQLQMIPIESSLNSLIKNQILLELAYT
jgi:hypothetical protein